jgi:two-component system, LytTR family, response regulator
MRLRTLIVEDSRLARAELRRLLDNHPEVEVVGEAANADEAELFIPDLRPDLLLLDIQMPGRNGFELLEALDSVPLVIFTTAYSEFAVQAFEKNALDYLVKPVQADRLAKALQKAEQAATQLGLDQPGANRSEPRDGEGEVGAGRILRGTDRVFVKDGEHCWFVPLTEVRLLEVEGNYTRLYFGTHQPLVPKTLNYLESRLDPQTFFRASRQHLVNLNWVKDVEPWFSGSLRLMLRSGQQVEVSRRQAQRFRDLMSL